MRDEQIIRLILSLLTHVVPESEMFDSNIISISSSFSPRFRLLFS